MYRGRVHFTSPVLWTIGFMVTFVIGGMTGVMLAIPAIDFVLHNSLFLIAHFHNVIIGGVVFGMFAGITYWFPKMFGFKLDETWGKRAFWCWFIGFYVAFMPLYALGFMGVTRRLQSYPNTDHQPFFIVAMIGAFIIGAGILCQFIQIIVSIRDRKKNVDLTGDPWDARTLEWETTSPVQFYNFAVLPKGEELDDFWERKQRGEAWPKPAKYSDIHMPRNTGAGVVIGAFSLVFGFAMIWHIWWLAIVGLVGMIGAFIARTFDKDVDYWVPAAEVERIENEHRKHLIAQGLVKTEVKA
jgi:cytochrome o ubiquinol oxidase subunit 1